MRSIPAALLAKLSQRWQADATDSKPNLKLIATQSSVNTLITEPIHNGITADYGDVALRQLPGETTPSYAYAICIDDGIANVYGRSLPADYEQAWAYLWTLGAATDVAIEYNGAWQITGNNDFYNLFTEQTPWIFWVANGTLYAQKWSDNSTMLTLATGVSCVSACRAWQSTINPTLDQGLIVAYIKNGAANYRAYCNETTGNMTWEIETAITELGAGLLSLQVFRTNDFRVGFITENATGMKWALSDRVYSGLSFRPEFLDAQIQGTTFSLIEIQTTNTQAADSLMATLAHEYAWMTPTTGAITLTATMTRISTTQFKFTFNVAIDGAENLAPYITVTPTSPVTGVSWNSGDNSLTITVGTPILSTTAVTIAIADSPDASFLVYQQQRQPFTAVSCSIAGSVWTHQCIEQETIAVSMVSVSMNFYAVYFRSTIEQETVAVSMTGVTITMTPVGILPI